MDGCCPGIYLSQYARIHLHVKNMQLYMKRDPSDVKIGLVIFAFLRRTRTKTSAATNSPFSWRPQQGSNCRKTPHAPSSWWAPAPVWRPLWVLFSIAVPLPRRGVQVHAINGYVMCNMRFSKVSFFVCGLCRASHLSCASFVCRELLRVSHQEAC